MSMCDDRQMAKPATGKTPVRNARIPDEVWLPALARAEMEGRTVSEAMAEVMRRYALEDPAPSYAFTFANWPQAAGWAQEHAGALKALNEDLDAALGPVPGEWLAIASWLASTHHAADPAQQKRVITGHLLRRSEAIPVRDRYRDSRHLSETVQAILDRHLPLAAS